MTDDPERSPKTQAHANKYLRNSATPEQAKQRRLNADPADRRRQITIEQLPLFADERSLSDAILGRGKFTHWRRLFSYWKVAASRKSTDLWADGIGQQ
jgi:hypothetical protein